MLRKAKNTPLTCLPLAYTELLLVGSWLHIELSPGSHVSPQNPKSCVEKSMKNKKINFEDKSSIETKNIKGIADYQTGKNTF